jgi:hypothetical protein
VVAVVVATRDADEDQPAAPPAAAPGTSAAATETPTPIKLVEPAPLWPRAPGRADWVDAALDLHPADTIVLVGLSVPALRDSKVIAAALEDEKEGAAGRYVAMFNAACGFDVLGSIDGVLLGAANDKEVQLDVSVRGRFTRAQVEACVSSLFADEDAGPITRKGALSRLVSDKQTVWMGWPDEHTVFITTRKGIGEDWMKKRLRRADTVRKTQALTALLDEVDTGAALWAVAAPPEPGESPLPGTKAPRAMYGSLLVASDLKVHAGLRYDAQADAEQMARALSSRLDGFKREPLAAMWLKDAGFGVRGNDTVFTASMDHTMAVITVKGILEQAKALE